MRLKKQLSWQEQMVREEIRRIPRQIPRKGQHYAHLVAEIKRKYGL